MTIKTVIALLAGVLALAGVSAAIADDGDDDLGQLESLQVSDDESSAAKTADAGATKPRSGASCGDQRANKVKRDDDDSAAQAATPAPAPPPAPAPAPAPVDDDDGYSDDAYYGGDDDGESDD